MTCGHGIIAITRPVVVAFAFIALPCTKIDAMSVKMSTLTKSNFLFTWLNSDCTILLHPRRWGFYYSNKLTGSSKQTWREISIKFGVIALFLVVCRQQKPYAKAPQRPYVAPQ